MKKYIKIFFRQKEHNITLPFEVVEQILTSPDQITMLKGKVGDEDNVWTGEIINKSEIVATHRDVEEERDQNRENDKSRLLDIHQETPEEREKISKITSELANKYKIPKK